MAIHALLLQTTYEHIEIGIARNDTLVDQKSIDKHTANSLLLITIEQLMEKNALSLKDFSYIAINQGPAPYTSLRVIIVAANALNFSVKIPLIGLDGLSLFMHEFYNKKYPITLGLFNAFNNDVFYALQTEPAIKKGCANITTLLHEIKNNSAQKTIRCIGSGVLVYQEEIKNILDDDVVIEHSLPMHVSLAYLAHHAFEKWQKQESVQEVFPLYMKTISYKPSSLC